MGRIAPDAQRHIYLLLLTVSESSLALPFHTWAPEAYAAAPAPAAMLHAGVLINWTVRFLASSHPDVARRRSSLGDSSRRAVTRQHHLHWTGYHRAEAARLDARLSSVMHMGYIFLGIASFGVLGVTGAVVSMFAHGLSIALLFGIAGELRRRTGTLAFDELGGLARVMPFAGLVFGLACSPQSVYRVCQFRRRNHYLFGAFRNGWEMGRFHIFKIATALALWGVVLSTVYMLRAYRRRSWALSRAMAKAARP